MKDILHITYDIDQEPIVLPKTTLDMIMAQDKWPEKRVRAAKAKLTALGLIKDERRVGKGGVQ